MKHILAAMALLTASCACGHAHHHHQAGHRHNHPPAAGTGAHGHWELLGQGTVDPHGDREVIALELACVCRTIRIDVNGADLEMWDLKVHFGNGEVFSPPIRHHFREGSRSRMIDLPGNTRVITRIAFHHRTTPRAGSRASVEAWGLH